MCTGICRRWRIQWMVPDVTIKPGYTWNRTESQLFQDPSSHQYTRSHSVSINYEYIYGCRGRGEAIKVPFFMEFSKKSKFNSKLWLDSSVYANILGGHTWSCGPCELNKHMGDKTEPNSARRKLRNETQNQENLIHIRLKLYTRIAPA